MSDTKTMIRLIERVGAHFPHWYNALSPSQIGDAAEDWQMILGDLDPKVIGMSIARLLSVPRQFPPTAGDINEVARMNALEKPMDAGDAWAGVCAAVQWGQWVPRLKDVLPQAAVKAAEAFGLERIRNRQIEQAGTDFAQFRGTYEAIQGRDKAAAILPPAIREQFAQVAAALDAKRLAAPKDDDK